MNAEKEHMKIVIVGHVDHGKSTLIGRLFYDTDSLPEDKIEEVRSICKSLGKEMEFGFIMDHLQEEREQGITIDTTQIFFKTPKREYVIIDAPGHVEFIKNMITGASQAEAAILIVDVAEGVQEQTKRHAYILGMLGLKQVVVVMNKMDIVNYEKKRYDQVKKELVEFLESIDIKPSFIIPISASKGDNLANKSKNMDWYDNLTVLEALDTFKIREIQTYKPLRFPIQDVYKIDDKRILVGRIASGTLKKGQEILFLPSNKKTQIKSVESFLKEKTEAEAGESIGVTLKDPLFIERGEILCEVNNVPITSNRITANVFWMSKDIFKKEEKIIMKCATQEIECKVEKIEKRINSSTLEVIEKDAEILENNEVGKMIIITENPIVVENFNEIQELGRFVLEKDMNVCAGGIITHMR